MKQPRHRSTAFGILALVAVSGSLLAFAPTGRRIDGTPFYYRWKSVTFNGTTVSNTYGMSQTPAGISVYANSNDNTVSVTVGSSANAPVSKTVDGNGDAVLLFKVPTDDPDGLSKSFVFAFPKQTSATAAAVAYGYGSSATGEATSGSSYGYAYAYAGHQIDEPEEPAPQPDQSETGSSTSTAQGGYYIVELPVASMTTTCTATASSGGGGGGGGTSGMPEDQDTQSSSQANASSTIKVPAMRTKKFSDNISRTGSGFREQTFFKTTRDDNVVDRERSSVRASDGTASFTGIGIPDVGLTIQLVQPGFLKQTIQRRVLNEEFVMPGTTGPIAPVAIELVFGDANGDNAITSTDVSIINGYVGKTKTSPGWNSVVPGSVKVGGRYVIRVKDLDENQDGQITSADVAVATANIGRTL